MCVIVNIPANVVLPKYILKNCYENNSHGWGIMYPNAGKLETVKDVTGYKEFLEAYEAIPENVPRAIHFRIKTHGLIDQENCHPFRVLDTRLDHKMDLGLMHNGVLPTALYDEKKSDTWNFSFYVLQPILERNQELLDNSGFRQMLEDVAGYSKLLFMNGSGETLIVNEDKGHKAHGCWFSNAHSLLAKYVPVQAPYSGEQTWHYKDGAVVRKGWDQEGWEDDWSGYNARQDAKTIPAVCSTGGAAGVSPRVVQYPSQEEIRQATIDALIKGNAKELTTAPPQDVEEVEELPPLSEKAKTALDLSEKLFIGGDANTTWDVLESALRSMNLHEIEEWIEEDTELAAMTISALVN